MELGPITTELLDTFKILYGFKTESYIIPAMMSHVDATWELRSKTRDFCQRFDGANNLFVVFYEGHAISHPALGLQLL